MKLLNKQGNPAFELPVGGSNGIWFEKLCDRASVPYWAGVILFGIIPLMVLLPVSYYAVGLWQDFANADLGLIPLLVVVTVYTLYASKFVRRRLEETAEYTGKLLPEGKGPQLRELYRVKGVATAYAVMMTVVQVFYISYELPRNYTLSQAMIISSAFFYWNVFVNTFVFVFLYALYKIYQVGRLPLKLKPFTEDRTLGLRPFGRLSLQLTLLYVLMIAIIILPQTALGFPAVPLAIFGSALMLAGVLFFLFPLLSLHRMLGEAKKAESARLAPQYTELVEKINRDGVGNSDVRIFQQLVGIDKVQRDIHQIHTWPFDVGIITRLAAIMFSVIAILLANYIRLILKF